jgi:hypothetical protein
MEYDGAMSPWLLVLCLGAEPSADGGTSLLTERLQAIVPRGWTMKETADGVTIAREAPVKLHIRGLADARLTPFSLVLTMGPQVTPQARAAILESNATTLRNLGKLEERMVSFATHGGADSEPDYRPVTKADRAVLQKHEALSKTLMVVPDRYVGDFLPVTATVFHGSGPRRPDESVDCADCEPLLRAVRERLSVYDTK